MMLCTLQMMGNMLGMNLHTAEPLAAAITGIEVHSSTAHNNAQEFEQILEDVKDLYSRLDAVFSDKGMDRIPCPGQKRRSVNDVFHGVRLEIAERRLMPANSRMIEEAVWNALRQLELQGLQRIDGFTADPPSCTEYADECTTTAMIKYFAAYYGDTNYIKGVNVRKMCGSMSNPIGPCSFIGHSWSHSFPVRFARPAYTQ